MTRRVGRSMFQLKQWENMIAVKDGGATGDAAVMLTLAGLASVQLDHFCDAVVLSICGISARTLNVQLCRLCYVSSWGFPF